MRLLVFENKLGGGGGGGGGVGARFSCCPEYSVEHILS